MSIFYIDGEYVNAAQAHIPATDLAVLRGYGVFDFLRTYGGIPFQLGAHLRRLQHSAALIELACPWDIEELGEIVLETVRRNRYPESNIRLVITGGEGERGFLPIDEPRLLVMATHWEAPPVWWYEGGVHVVTTELHRHLPQAKTIHYIPAIMAQRKASERDPKAIEAIYTTKGFVSEGTRSNTFIYEGDRWITPAADLLHGITRAEVIKLLQADGLLELRDITLADFRAADEIILTSSTKEIVPVVKVDDVIVGDGAPGAMTRRLMRQWRAMTVAYARTGTVL